MDMDRLSLKDAAKRANVSPRTIRRWIKEGKLTGDKEPGPYGDQFYVSADQLERAQNAKELAPPAQPGESTAQVVRAILNERDAAITNALESLHAVVGQGIQRHHLRLVAGWPGYWELRAPESQMGTDRVREMLTAASPSMLVRMLVVARCAAGSALYTAPTWAVMSGQPTVLAKSGFTLSIPDLCSDVAGITGRITGLRTAASRVAGLADE